MGRRTQLSFLPFLLMLLLVGSGCQDDRIDATGDFLVSPAAAQDLTAEDALANPVSLPPLEKITEAVQADEAQAAALADAYGTWTAAIEARRTERPRGGQARSERQGPPSAEDIATRSRPGQDFLMASAEALEPEQRVQLLELLAEHREAAQDQRATLRGQRGDRRGRGPQAGQRGQGQRGQGQRAGADPEHALFGQLDLSDEQKERLQTVHAETRDALRTLLQDVDREEGPSEEQREEATQLRAALQDQVQAVLTEAQWQRLQELRSERRLEHAQRADAAFEVRLGQRLDLLTAVLGLSDAQRTEVEALLQAQHEEVASERRAGNWSEGGPMAGRFADRGARGEQRQAVQTAIAGLLDDQQKSVFEALVALAPEPGERGHAPGPWGRGRHGGGSRRAPR